MRGILFVFRPIYKVKEKTLITMGTYIHKFNSIEEMEKSYKDVQSGPESFECSAGTFTWEQKKWVEGWNDFAFFWTNGDTELVTRSRTPKVGIIDYEDPETFDLGAFTWNEQIVDLDNPIEIISVGKVVPARYHAPWVSATANGNVNRIATTLEGEEGESVFELVGKVQYDPVK